VPGLIDVARLRATTPTSLRQTPTSLRAEGEFTQGSLTQTSPIPRGSLSRDSDENALNQSPESTSGKEVDENAYLEKEKKQTKTASYLQSDAHALDAKKK
jgi:hypothetical protein